MKIFNLVLLLIGCSKVFSQDNPVVQHIDSVVYQINHSGLPEINDSMTQEYHGLTTKTYMTLVKDGNAVKKYSIHIVSVQVVDAATKQLIGNTSLYFDQNKFIKAEDFGTSDGKEMNYAWYFADGKCIYPEIVSEKEERRVTTLIAMAGGFTKAFSK